MTYEEYLYKICTNTNMEDPEDATELVQFLCEELLRYYKCNAFYEEKCKELMSAKDFEKWSKDKAKDLFRDTINRLDDSDFKDFCLEHFEEVTTI